VLRRDHIRRLTADDVVDQNRASWNRVTSWLHDLERLRRAA
jgi:hypothetical protein